jgi:hypothetical protein
VSAHVVQWATASPLWPDVLRADPGSDEARGRMRRPALLRFASDSFMDDLAGLLADEPARLTDFEAKPESFRPPPPGEDPGWTPQIERLKLFQAAHGRFYLVAATLACRLPGLPEHPHDPARRETVSFVLRRLHDDAEWAWETDPGTGAKGWAEVPEGQEAAVARGEDLLPLFPVNYDDEEERRRRLYVGLVPTSSRETFAAAGPLSPLAAETAPPGETPDPRKVALETLVLLPMRELPDDLSSDSPLTGQERTEAQQAIAAKRVELSRFALLELIGLLRTSIPALFAAIAEGGSRPGGDAGTFYDRLAARRVGPFGFPTWLQALEKAWEERLPIAGEDDDSQITLQADLSSSTLTGDELEDLFADALPPLASAEGAAGAAAAAGTQEPPQVPKLEARGEAVYVLRCVYRRPDCGPLHPDVVSEPTDEFTIAPYFDLDAPARSVMVSLPIDTSIKDLRRFQKGVSFLISDELRKQMSRASSLKDALDGNVSSGQQFNLGLICSFSIPIITIVALILLLVIVSLLNFVFGWMPYLRICFPMLLKAK